MHGARTSAGLFLIAQQPVPVQRLITKLKPIGGRKAREFALLGRIPIGVAVLTANRPEVLFRHLLSAVVVAAQF